jgi:hypothetical protein
VDSITTGGGFRATGGGFTCRGGGGGREGADEADDKVAVLLRLDVEREVLRLCGGDEVPTQDPRLVGGVHTC